MSMIQISSSPQMIDFQFWAGGTLLFSFGNFFFLHANFKLSRNGGYLALIKPDKKTVVFDYSPTYPIQFSDVSYGSSMLTTTQNTTLGEIKGYFLLLQVH